MKEELAAVSDSVRRKFNALKSGRIETAKALEKMYEPLTKPLNVISKAADVKHERDAISSVKGERKPKLLDSTKYETTLKDSDGDDDGDEFATPNDSENDGGGEYSDNDDDGAEYIDNHLKEILRGNKLYDTRYGVYIDKDMKKTMMGNLEIKFTDGKISFWDGNDKVAEYDGNLGLYELIFYRQPNKKSDVNMQTYKEILELTGAPFVQYDKSKGLSKKRLHKMTKIINPLFSQLGKGFLKIPKYKKMTSSKPNYVYWNKPKELVTRLRLLWSSKQAGHNGHDNEILSIIEELREEGIIY